MLTADELRDVPGFSGYAVTRAGRVWSKKRRAFMRCWANAKGYMLVELALADKPRQMRVHRMVALAWIPNPTGLPEINHLDGVKANNAADNLEWCTTEQNIRHAHRTGLMHNRRGPSKLRPDEVAIIKARLARGDRQKDIAADYKVTPPNISAIHSGLTWRDVAPAVMP